MWRAVASNGLTLLIVMFLVMGGLGIWAKGQYAAQGTLEASMCFRVPPGANFRDTADRLAEQGAVQSAAFSASVHGMRKKPHALRRVVS